MNISDVTWLRLEYNIIIITIVQTLLVTKMYIIRMSRTQKKRKAEPARISLRSRVSRDYFILKFKSHLMWAQSY